MFVGQYGTRPGSASGPASTAAKDGGGGGATMARRSSTVVQPHPSTIDTVVRVATAIRVFIAVPRAGGQLELGAAERERRFEADCAYSSCSSSVACMKKSTC
ncbi:MAG: hypothetical protein BGO98_27030 [Myxococcales bacterium 68-20]|nr:MAG: hypothetical protein BGO98_27030 [Myxococcales bacterium 68-20]